ncbi:YjbH domain-containing protein [Thalassococcus sp. BH17M4-6]|uniref:YjbH domain-containing protein n=1 Tax=Thalassococcus sp. BH17M4-6 TaxID=3413148 RepID=UPI003BF4DFDE
MTRRRCAKMSIVHTRWLAGLATGALIAAPLSAPAESPVSYNLYGSPGLVDMPTADAAPDATLATTLSTFGDNTRTTINFQITPRISGSFRYSSIQNFVTVASLDGDYYDRSFDMRFQLLTEGRLRPAVTLGFQDFIGTGLYSGEYVVASKTVAPGLRLTGGVGWGRFGSYKPFASPSVRPAVVIGRGGVPTYDRWFRGDMAAFGGVSYSPNDKLTFKLEYSSDNYDEERRTGQFDGNSPWNFGVDYRFDSGTQLSLYHAYGTEIGAQVTFVLNPKKGYIPGGSETAPLPVQVRARDSVNDLGWTQNPNAVPTAKRKLASALETDGIGLEGLSITDRRATLRIRNLTYLGVPQAVGRSARAMTRHLPASVEEFVIIPTESGIPTSAIVMRRSDVEALENEAAAEMLARTQIIDAFGKAPAVEPGIYPRLTWSFAPYVAVGYFDPDAPLRADLGLRLRGSYELTPGFVLSGAVTKKLLGNLGDSDRTPNTGLPQVRTTTSRYAREGDPALEYLTLAHYGRPGPDLYSRVTLGYLEEMYAGASAELLWKPVDSRLALGAELNYVRRRDFDQLFGLQSNTTPSGEIPDLNGHVSAYYAFGNGFHGQLDVGRYLAGDYGATVSLDREFANGWKIGAYATFTNASAEDFGEGSFDKGIRFSIPLSWALGNASKQVSNIGIQSLTRDGGARLNVRGRLYDQVRSDHRPDLAKTWGTFWR